MLTVTSKDAQFFMAFGAMGGAFSGLCNEALPSEISDLAAWSLGSAFDGAWIGMALAVARQLYATRAVSVPRVARVAVLVGMGGVLAGLAALWIGFPVPDALGLAPDVGLAAAWALSGVVLAFFLDKALPSRLPLSWSLGLGGAAGLGGFAMILVFESPILSSGILGLVLGGAIALGVPVSKTA